MKKKNSKIISVLIGVVCLILVTGAFGVLYITALNKAESRRASLSFTQEIKVKDGITEPRMTERELSVTEAGRYYFCESWEATQSDFLTGCVIKDEDGQVVYAHTGDTVKGMSLDLELKAQTYKVEMHYLANEADYFQFVEDYIGKTVKPGPFAFSGAVTDSVWVVEYTVEARGVFNGHVIVIGAALIDALIIVILFLTLVKKGNGGKLEYDERQELVRGKGAKYGFFALLFSNGLVYAAELAELPQLADMSAVMILNCFIGVCVYMVYCIWNDGYLALNAHKGCLMAGFAVFGICGLLSSVDGFISGKMIQNGRLTFRSGSLFCSIFFVVVFTVMLLKRYRSDKEDE